MGEAGLEPWQLLALIGLALAAAEIFTPSFFALPAALAFWVTAGAALFVEGWVTLLLILALSLGVIYFVFYKYLWEHLRKDSKKTNADAMAGKIATVVEQVEPASGAGEVKLYGDTFRVVATASFAVGTKVMITGTEGNRVHIRALAEGED